MIKKIHRILETCFSSTWGKLLGFFVGALTFYMGWQTFVAVPRLTCIDSISQQFFAQNSIGNNSLELRLNGSLMRDPTQTTIKFINTGGKSISIESYTDVVALNKKGLLLTCNKNSKIISCMVVASQPAARATTDLLSCATLVNNSDVFIKPIALNPSESFDIQILSDGESKPFNLLGHIADGSIVHEHQNLNFRPWQKLFLNIILYGGAGSGFIALSAIIFGVLFTKALFKEVFQRIGSWMHSVSLRWSIRSAVTTPDRAKEILLSKTQFDDTAASVHANTQADKEQMRILLQQLANPVDTTETTATGLGDGRLTSVDLNEPNEIKSTQSDIPVRLEP